MELGDHFIDAFGEPLLLPGPAIDAPEHLFEPHAVRLEQIVPVLGQTGSSDFSGV
jgi:hypothetical protein